MGGIPRRRCRRPIVRVFGSGRVAMDCGSVLSVSSRGVLSDSTMNVYDSRWLPNTFAPVRAELAEIHAMARERAQEKYGEDWAPLDNDVTRLIGPHTLKRVVAAVRNSRHGAPRHRPAEPGRDILGTATGP